MTPNTERLDIQPMIKHYTRKEILEVLNEMKCTMIEFLKMIQRVGYLLHGSNQPNIEKFIPNIPQDPRGGWTTQKGVYATSTAQPIFFAIINRSLKGPRYYFESGTYNGESYYAVSPDYFQNDGIIPGMIYIFNSMGFIENPENHGEWLSKEAVVPIGKIPVTVEDLPTPIKKIAIPNKDTDWTTYTPRFID